MIKARSLLKSLFLYGALAFPAFYFVYKFGNPDYGCRDYRDYYTLFKDLDVNGVDAPFNMRLLGSFFVHMLYKMGMHYDTEIIFSKNGLDQSVFFCALLFNFFSVIGTCIVLFHLLKKYFNDVFYAFGGGLLYLLGFGTLFFVLMPITDAFSIFLFSIAFYYYLQKRYALLVVLVLLIFQREYYFMALGLIALCDYWKHRDRFYLYTLLVCILCFTIYIILRKTVFYTPKYDHQASTGFFLNSIFSLKFPLVPFIKQTLMTMNISFIYIAVLIYKKMKGLSIDKFAFIKILLLFLQISIISFAAVFGNNMGRYFYMLIPIVIFYLMSELSVFRASAGQHERSN
jgi:hypothetical protein